ncbi:hypothetical protein NL676_000548 [Syzygium grande]|nr:hypothetical protein NL676_000548 [Syzygium grande]
MMKIQDVGRLRAASLLVVSLFRNEQRKYVEQRRKPSVLTENRDGAPVRLASWLRGRCGWRRGDHNVADSMGAPQVTAALIPS